MPETAGPAKRATPAPLRTARGSSAAGRTPDLAQRVQAQAEGLRPMVATAEAVQEARAKRHGAPRWTDVFTTQFTEFSNRPR